VTGFALLARFFQSGHIYHYAFTMIFGVFALLTLWFFAQGWLLLIGA